MHHTHGCKPLFGTATPPDTHLCQVLPHTRIHTFVWYCHTRMQTSVMLPTHARSFLVFCHTDVFTPMSGIVTPAYARICPVPATHARNYASTTLSNTDQPIFRWLPSYFIQQIIAKIILIFTTIVRSIYKTQQVNSIRSVVMFQKLSTNIFHERVPIKSK
jgi:hypothetical protein